jgi:XTP/dITP diphosphohydrolase
MARQLVLASANRGKVAEFKRILTGLDVELLDARAVTLPQVDETGATFSENALLKARAAARATGLPCVADDSGLAVDALHGEPGVRSARYAGTQGDDQANLDLVLERMRGATDHRARFVCVAALVAPDGREWTAEGILEGHLVHSPRGTHGFGYDPIFVPLGETRTTAEMRPEEKDAISHRGQAFRALRPAVAAVIGG